MKFKNPNLIVMNRRTDKQAQSDKPPQLFQSRGHKNLWPFNLQTLQLSHLPPLNMDKSYYFAKYL